MTNLTIVTAILYIIIFGLSCKKIKKELETNETFDGVSFGEKKGDKSLLYSKFTICNNEDYTSSPVGGGVGFTDPVLSWKPLYTSYFPRSTFKYGNLK